MGEACPSWYKQRVLFGWTHRGSRVTWTAPIALGLASIACTPAEGPIAIAPAPVSAPPEIAEDRREAPESGESGAKDLHPQPLVIGTREFPDNLDPMGALPPWGQRIVDDVLFEGLTRRQPDRAPFAEPALADRCIAIPQAVPRDVYCHLRPDARFHDGRPVTLDDVLYSLSYWTDPRRSPLRIRHGLVQLEEVTAAAHLPTTIGALNDGAWVHLAFAQPQPLALERIAAMKIVPASAHRGRGRQFGRSPIGTGPMRVVEFDTEHLVLERTPTPADETPPLRILFLALNDGAEAMTRLRRGDVHVVDDVAPIHLPDELTRPGMSPRFNAYLLTPPRFDLLLYNLRRGLLDDSRIRESLHRAIPRHALEMLSGMPSADVIAPIDQHEPVTIDLAALGKAGPSARWGDAGLPAFAEDGPSDAATSELDLLELFAEHAPRGTRRVPGRPRLVLTWNGERGRGGDVAGTLRQAWRTIGIDTLYATASWAYIFGLMRKGEYDLGLCTVGLHSDEDLYPVFHSRGDANLTGVADRELDDALEAYQGARSREERDEAKRRIATRLAALRPVTVLYAPTRVMLMSKRVSEPSFIDDLPRLDQLRLGPESTWATG